MASTDLRRNEALAKFQQKLQEHRQLEANLKSIREKTQDFEKSFNKSEDDLKALQSVGQVGVCFVSGVRSLTLSLDDWRGSPAAHG